MSESQRSRHALERWSIGRRVELFQLLAQADGLDFAVELSRVFHRQPTDIVAMLAKEGERPLVAGVAFKPDRVEASRKHLLFDRTEELAAKALPMKARIDPEVRDHIVGVFARRPSCGHAVSFDNEDAMPEGLRETCKGFCRVRFQDSRQPQRRACDPPCLQADGRKMGRILFICVANDDHVLVPMARRDKASAQRFFQSYRE